MLRKFESSWPQYCNTRLECVISYDCLAGGVLWEFFFFLLRNVTQSACGYKFWCRWWISDNLFDQFYKYIKSTWCTLWLASCVQIRRKPIILLYLVFKSLHTPLLRAIQSGACHEGRKWLNFTFRKHNDSLVLRGGCIFTVSQCKEIKKNKVSQLIITSHYTHDYDFCFFSALIIAVETFCCVEPLMHFPINHACSL